jgi:hypothetical protein
LNVTCTRRTIDAWQVVPSSVPVVTLRRLTEPISLGFSTEYCVPITCRGGALAAAPELTNPRVLLSTSWQIACSIRKPVLAEPKSLFWARRSAVPSCGPTPAETPPEFRSRIALATVDCQSLAPPFGQPPNRQPGRGRGAAGGVAAQVGALDQGGAAVDQDVEVVVRDRLVGRRAGAEDAGLAARIDLHRVEEAPDGADQDIGRHPAGRPGRRWW